MLRSLFLPGVVWALVLTAQTPPHSGWNPPGAAATASLTESTKSATRDWLTLAEKSDYQQTGRYDETLAFYRRLATTSPWVKVQVLGKTPQGRDLLLVVVSKGVQDARKTTVLIQNGIHSGEIGGKDASAMLLRDIVLNKRYASLLDHLTLLFIPVFNVDGHEQFSPYNRINQNGPREMGLRATVQQLNLNRDYMKAETPEMQMWLRVWREWSPDFLIDNHVTDGEDHQYDLTIAMPTGPATSPAIADWTASKFMPNLDRRMTAGGHLMAPYGGYRGDGYYGMIFEPRYSHAYAGICNRPGLLVETHSLKTYKVQVWAHYDVMLHTLQLLAGDTLLQPSIRTADSTMLAGSKVYLHGKLSSQGQPFTFHGVASHKEKSSLTGAEYQVYESKPDDIETKIFNAIETTAEVIAPVAYVVPQEWTDVVRLLEMHGIKSTLMSKVETRDVEVYRIPEPRWDSQPFEGHLRVSGKPELGRVKRKFAAGDFVVSMNQPRARLAMNILEPLAPDSVFQWGLLNAAFGRREGFSAASYVTEPLMQEFAAKSPELRAEFESKLKNDAEFSRNPRARMTWWLERSPFARTTNEYPIYRIPQ